MSTLFLMMVALLVLWFTISFFVVNYDRKKMQKTFNVFFKENKENQ